MTFCKSFQSTTAIRAVHAVLLLQAVYSGVLCVVTQRTATVGQTEIHNSCLCVCERECVRGRARAFACWAARSTNVSPLHARELRATLFSLILRPTLTQIQTTTTTHTHTQNYTLQQKSISQLINFTKHIKKYLTLQWHNCLFVLLVLKYEKMLCFYAQHLLKHLLLLLKVSVDLPYFMLVWVKMI